MWEAGWVGRNWAKSGGVWLNETEKDGERL